MRHRLFSVVAFLCIAPATFSQTAALKEIHAEGLKTLNEPQLVQLTGLTIDSQVGRTDLQGAADILLRSGMFAKVNYSFATRNDAVIVTFKVEENPRLKVSYDNFPWYADSELADAIRTVHSGKKSVPLDVASHLAEHLSSVSLTEREIEVLRHITGGNRNKDIAERLFISEETVKIHVKHIMEKLGASDRTQAMAIAVRRGIIEL